MRLTQGEATERVEHTGTVGLQAIAFKTEKEIRAALASDPMTNVKELIPEHSSKIGPTQGMNELQKLEDNARAAMAREIEGRKVKS